jgi:hypothetical protein
MFEVPVFVGLHDLVDYVLTVNETAGVAAS